MSDPTHRATRRNLATQPIQGGPTKGQKIRHTPISPDELAEIIEHARAQRTEEDITAYALERGPDGHTNL